MDVDTKEELIDKVIAMKYLTEMSLDYHNNQQGRRNSRLWDKLSDPTYVGSNAGQHDSFGAAADIQEL